MFPLTKSFSALNFAERQRSEDFNLTLTIKLVRSLLLFIQPMIFLVWQCRLVKTLPCHNKGCFFDDRYLSQRVVHFLRWFQPDFLENSSMLQCWQFTSFSLTPVLCHTFLFLKRPRRLTSSISKHFKKRKFLRETHYLIQGYMNFILLFICPNNK